MACAVWCNVDGRLVQPDVPVQGAERSHRRFTHRRRHSTHGRLARHGTARRQFTRTGRRLRSTRSSTTGSRRRTADRSTGRGVDRRALLCRRRWHSRSARSHRCRTWCTGRIGRRSEALLWCRSRGHAHRVFGQDGSRAFVTVGCCNSLIPSGLRGVIFFGPTSNSNLILVVVVDRFTRADVRSHDAGCPLSCVMASAVAIVRVPLCFGLPNYQTSI